MAIAKSILLDGTTQAPPKKPENDEFKNFLEDKFSSLMETKDAGYKKMGDFRIFEIFTFFTCIEKKKEVLGEKVDKAKDEMIEKYMKEYNAQNRPKSLLQQHQVDMKFKIFLKLS